MIRGLEKLREGVYLNPDDRHYLYKRMQYGGRDCFSPLTEARLLAEAGQTQKARELYLKLLTVKDSYEIHTELAPLLTADQATRMARKYQKLHDLHKHRNETPSGPHRTYGDIAGVYYAEVLARNPFHREARAFFQHAGRSRWRRLMLTTWLIALLALVALGLWALHHWRVVDTTMITHIQNEVSYVDALPNPPDTLGRRIQVSNPNDVQSVANAVDASVKVPGTRYAILSGQALVGDAELQTPGHFAIRLLQTYSSRSTAASESAGPRSRRVGIPSKSAGLPSNYQLDSIRTAFVYYLSTHDQVPPIHLDELSRDLPSPVDLSSVSYHYPETDPVAAIRPPSNALVPFQPPTVYVHLNAHRLALKHGDHVLLTAPVGEGNVDQPTPTGTFTVTKRLESTPNGVYGPYIFPLNNSPFAIHGTNAISRLGKDQSLGCVEVNNVIDRQLYQLIPVGTPVVISADDSDSSPVPTSFR